jgi:hypothetical protein
MAGQRRAALSLSERSMALDAEKTTEDVAKPELTTA